MENGKQSAFPLMWDQRHNPQFKTEEGLTKREKFAIMAMQGMLANHSMADNIDKSSLNTIATAATRSADALLAALEKPLTNH